MNLIQLVLKHFVQTEEYTGNENYEKTYPECLVTVKKLFPFREILIVSTQMVEEQIWDSTFK